MTIESENKAFLKKKASGKNFLLMPKGKPKANCFQLCKEIIK
jgi:hypothetical protein